MSKAKRPGRPPSRGARPASPRSSPRAAQVGGVTAEGWAEALLWILFLLVPLLVAPTAKESFRLPKLLASEGLGLASLLPLAFRLHGVERVRWRDLRGARALVAVAPLLAVATLGLATSHHPFHLREALADLWIGAACLVGWSVGLSRRRRERLLAGLLVPATVLALLGILQFHGLYRPLQFEGAAQAGRFAVTSLAGNPGDFGAYLVLPCLLAQGLLVRERRGRGRGPLLVAIAAALSICLYAMAATQTISALAAVAVGSLVFWAFLAPRRLLVPAAASALGLLLVLILAVAPLRARLAQKADELAHGSWNGVLSGRLDGWRAALWMLGEHPLAGVGQGAFRAEFAPAKLALLDRGAQFFSGQLDVNFFNAHNEILEVGADLGVLGLLALGWGLWVFLRTLLRRRDGEDPEGVGLAWGGTMALAILALFQFPFRIGLVAFPALLFLAAVFAGGAPLPVQEEESAGEGVRGSALGWGLAAALAVALVAQGSRWYDRLQGSALLLQVELVTRSAAAAGHAPSTLLPTHLEMLARAAALDPAEVEIPLARGNQYLLFHNPGAAIPQYRAAAALQPGPEVYFDLAGALLTAGESAEARRNFALAVRLDPGLASRLPTEMK